MSRYTVYLTPVAWNQIKRLPGYLRQQVRRAVSAFSANPRPGKSKPLRVSGLACEVRRLRMERWRIVYAIMEKQKLVDVLAVRKRPPYDYGDLARLLKDYPPA